MSEIFLISSTIGIETSSTALSKFLFKEVKTVNLDKTVISTFSGFPEGIKRVFLFGDFWSEQYVEDLSTKYEVTQFKFNSTQPLLDLYSFSKEKCLTEQEITEECKNAMSICDKRLCSIDNANTQEFITGMFNIKPNLSLEERYLELLKGLITVKDATNIGIMYTEYQTSLVKERVNKNSRTGLTTSGLKYAVVNSPEFVNISHDFLKEKYPDCDITIVTWLNFKDGFSDTVSQSIRSYNPEISAKELIGKFGGGTETAAGGKKEIDIHIDF